MKRILAAVFLSASLTVAPAWAQPGGMGGGLGMGNMSKFFGDNKAFTSKVDTEMAGSSLPSPMTTELVMVMLDGKTRIEMDLSKAKGAEAMAAMSKQMGIDKSVTILRPDKKMSYMVFPNLHAYAEMVMTDEEAAQMADESAKVEKTSMGKETINGHSCEKNKMTVTGKNGQKDEVMVWNASDMKNFPAQMQMSEQGSTVTMKFKDVKLEKPDAKLFDPPTGFTKYSSMQTLMQTEAMKRAGAGGPGSK